MKADGWLIGVVTPLWKWKAGLNVCEPEVSQLGVVLGPKSISCPGWRDSAKPQESGTWSLQLMIVSPSGVPVR